MGIRVHKVIGYGLDNLEVTGPDCTDPRIVHPRPWWDEEADKKGGDFPAFVDYVKDKYGEDLGALMETWHLQQYINGNQKLSWSVYLNNSFILDCEYGLPIFLVRPSYYTEWSRYDDTMDWVEETYCNGPARQHNWYKKLENGIFPYSGIFVDRRDPTTRLNMVRTADFIRVKNLVLDTPITKEKPEATQAILDKYAVELGFSGSNDAIANMVPEVPSCIRDLCDYFGVFTDPSTVFDLRPMIYCYWS